MPPKITRLRISNFKGFSSYTVTIKDLNVLVGPNNAGKSTVLDAFRALSGAFRYARTKLPEKLRNHEGQLVYGYRIPESSIPVNPSNLQTDYSDEPSLLEFYLDGGEIVRLSLSKSKGPVLSFDSERRVTSLAMLRERYPTQIAVVPTLGPLEEEEELLTKDYVDRWSSTRRSHRLFRNYWLNQPAPVFEEFRERLESTWPSMSVMRPEIDWASRTVRMFAKEGRIDREVSWAGFGFQVWMQVLTHLIDAKNSSVVVIDEPEVYLHPDLQHKLFGLLSSLNGQVLLATHSVEIINDADADELVLVNKANKHSKRLTDVDSVQGVVHALGSTQNIVLSKLSSSKRMLFFEGKDFKLVRKIAGKVGFDHLQSASEMHVVPVGGFTQAHKVENVSWTFQQILQTSVSVAALFDRDYRCEEENQEFLNRLRSQVPLTFVLGRKELENYLLDEDAFEKAINERLRERGAAPVSPSYVTQLFDDVSEMFRAEVAGQIAAHKSRYFQSAGNKKDMSTIITSAITKFESDWAIRSERIKLVPGKSMLAALNMRLQQDRQVSVTESSLVRHMNPKNIGADFLDILAALDEFAR